MQEPKESISDFCKVVKNCYLYYKSKIMSSGLPGIPMDSELMNPLYQLYDPNTIRKVNDFLNSNNFFVVDNSHIKDGSILLPNDQRLLRLCVKYFDINQEYHFLPSFSFLISGAPKLPKVTLKEDGSESDTKDKIKRKCIRGPRIPLALAWDVPLCADIISKIHAYYKRKPITLCREDMAKEIEIERLSRGSESSKVQFIKFFEHFLAVKGFLLQGTAKTRAFIKNTSATEKEFPKIDELSELFKEFTKNIRPQDIWSFRFPKPESTRGSKFECRGDMIYDESSSMSVKFSKS